MCLSYSSWELPGNIPICLYKISPGLLARHGVWLWIGAEYGTQLVDTRREFNGAASKAHRFVEQAIAIRRRKQYKQQY